MCLCLGVLEATVGLAALGAAVNTARKMRREANAPCGRCAQPLKDHVADPAARKPHVCHAWRTPDPGSVAATAGGCTCPILDNAHGKGSGWGPGKFWISADCPMHGRKED